MEPLDIENPFNKEEIPPSKIPLIIYTILGIIIIALSYGIILVIVYKKFPNTKTEYIDKEVPTPYYIPIELPNIDNNFFGEIKMNLTYDIDGKIKNTFGVGGDNHIEEVGNVHNGVDYNKTEKNIYDLYIPSSALLNKNGTNGIFLFIHGGAWVGGLKVEMEKFFISYGQMGYITANMEYTLLVNNSADTNIFRMVDEISACIENIKEQLINKGFNQNKLELAILGYSAGAHLTLLYSYLIKKPPIKIKFTVNICGPISLERKYNLRLKTVNDTLESLNISEIEKAKDEGRLIDTVITNIYIPLFLNLFIGSKYSYNELLEMLNITENNVEIIYENPKFQDLFNRTKFAFPLYIEDKNKVPVLCYYDGNDEVVGVMAFGYLEEKAKNDSKPYELIYSKYASHDFYDFNKEDSVNNLRLLNLKINEYAKKYFTHE